MMGALIAAFDAAGRAKSVRAILLTGTGDHFCGGADIVARNADRALARGSVPSSADSPPRRTV